MNVSDSQPPLSLSLTALSGIPLVHPGDCLISLILRSLKQTKLSLADGDILVIAQKIVSKAEGRYVRLANVKPSERALELATFTEKDPRLVELILTESSEIVRQSNGVIVVENHHGVVLANAGIDHSNVETENDSEQVLLLPLDPDLSALNIRKQLEKKTKVNVAVIINDSIGRAWRNGTIGTAIGVSGLPSILDLRGQPDLFGKPLRSSEEAITDELSSAASLLQGQAGEGLPVVLIRGYSFPTAPFNASAAIGASGLIRPKEKDLFR
ncbi:MAG: coenzyme F420-0:L-glutamate ligase [Deltaproteobacteria bacterium]|jgi:coenzyme F420-0:L-glutamate ligase/coenzyme F420-1:gamma-L-glutamate ligase|nr:coenzyme F420-0:L-glutamate ligase [Deltaproteobacteria bacterium]MBT6856763.1 coenzyme F420-0:L-glutamate ligase [Nitrospina sp.]